MLLSYHHVRNYNIDPLDAYNELLERNAGVRSTRMTSAGITTIEVDVSTFFGLPQTISFMGLKIDVDRDLYSVHSRDGDKEKIKTFFLTGGVVASYLEGEVFRQLFGGEAVSTMHILEAANRQGIRIYTITKENVESILPKLQYKAIKSKCSKI